VQKRKTADKLKKGSECSLKFEKATPAGEPFASNKMETFRSLATLRGVLLLFY